MNTLTLPTTAQPIGNTRLFDATVEEQILLSVHLLGKPTAAQLFRLYQDQVSTLRQMQGILRRLSTGPDRMLNVINPIDIAQPIRSLPYIYLDTTRSRRTIEQLFGVPFRRVPPVPSRDWRFLRHDVEMCDELVAFELTARKTGQSFGYQPSFLEDGKHTFPKVSISHDGLTYTLRPQPDCTLLFADHTIILEHDCGEETVECGNIIRDATIGRKQLVYDALFRGDPTRWKKTFVAYVVQGKSGSHKAARRRIKRCLKTIPEHVDARRIFFVGRNEFCEHGNDSANLVWRRGDGVNRPLPCF